jgi:hypothetical protein
LFIYSGLMAMLLHNEGGLYGFAIRCITYLPTRRRLDFTTRWSGGLQADIQVFPLPTVRLAALKRKRVGLCNLNRAWL